jgi:hypothetical protein
MSAFGGKADIIQGKADIKKCPLMTQSGHRGKPSPFQRVNVGAYDAFPSMGHP